MNPPSLRKLKVMTVVGTRPEIIKLSRVIHELDEQTDHVLVHTNQNFDYELNGVFFEQLEIRPPNHVLDAAAETPAGTIANVIARCDHVLEQERPEAFLLLGDTNSCLAAIVAKRRKIPIFHMEAGNRCFDFRVPEEINRRLVDHISDVNLPYTEHARRNLLAEGLPPDLVIKTGSPMKEVIDFAMARAEQSNVLAELEVRPGEFVVVSAHREETVDDADNFGNLAQTLNAVAQRYAMPVIVSTHPRTRKRLEEPGTPAFDPKIRFLRPLGFHEYLTLQKNAMCVLSDSGTLTEEAALVGFPGVMIRNTHERPEGMDHGIVVMSGLQPERVLGAIELVTAHRQQGVRFQLPPDYDCDNVSKKVVRIILSYTDYVNDTVWKKRPGKAVAAAE